MASSSLSWSPARGGWGTPDSEAAYLEACLGEVIGNDAGGTRETAPRRRGPDRQGDPQRRHHLFLLHRPLLQLLCRLRRGLRGAGVLDRREPLYVISQAFIGGKSVGSGYLDQAAARTYNGYNVSTYHPRL